MMDGKSWKHACQVYFGQVDDENRSIGMENPINYQGQKQQKGSFETRGDTFGYPI